MTGSVDFISRTRTIRLPQIPFDTPIVRNTWVERENGAEGGVGRSWTVTDHKSAEEDGLAEAISFAKGDA
jgi:hypothetical protein